MTNPAILPERGMGDRISAAFWRRPRLLLILLLTPPLLWLGIVYLGSLAALLLQSFYSIDEFSGVVKQEFTLKTYAELFRAQNLDIILRTLLMAILVTLASAVIAFPSPISPPALPRGAGKLCSIWASCCRFGRPIWSRFMPGN
jgi:putative spermidine/putrescine transport system permease protein